MHRGVHAARLPLELVTCLVHVINGPRQRVRVGVLRELNVAVVDEQGGARVLDGVVRVVLDVELQQIGRQTAQRDLALPRLEEELDGVDDLCARDAAGATAGAW